MGSIIIAMPTQKDSARLKDMIRRSGLWEDVSICSYGAEVLANIKAQEVHVVVCTVKFSDMGYEELANYLPNGVNILLLTKNASLVPFSSNVIKLLTPFKVEDFISTIRTLLPMRYPAKKKKKPQRSPEEQKIIDDAKRLLMDRNDMTEPEAFRYIQKISMDTGRNMVESAQMIIMLNE